MKTQRRPLVGQSTVWQVLVQRLIHYWALLARPMTLSVRAVLINPQGEVLLVRHTYMRGWHLPGGGVEGGESFQESLARELAEEANVIMDESPRLHGVFFNSAASPRDHIAVYVVRRFHETGPREPDYEIAEAMFFPLDSLPQNTGRASRARIEEVCNGAIVGAIWQ